MLNTSSITVVNHSLSHFSYKSFNLFVAKDSPTIYHIFLNSLWWAASGLKAEVPYWMRNVGSGDTLGTALARVACKDIEGKNKPLLYFINSVEWYMSFNLFASSVGNEQLSAWLNLANQHECWMKQDRFQDFY